jgi:hypothetical protein
MDAFLRARIVGAPRAPVDTRMAFRRHAPLVRLTGRRRTGEAQQDQPRS